VPDLWRPGGPSINCVEGDHFGKKVAIPRGDEPDVAARPPLVIKWENPFPHRLESYRTALENALRQTRSDRLDSTGKKASAPTAEF